MKVFWRISNYADLSGMGGLYGPGRWHERGNKVVYLADHPSTALLETLVHLELDEETYPDPRKMLEVHAPDDCRIITLDPGEGIGWAGEISRTQRLGTDWLQSVKSPLAVVPSALVSGAHNYLLNPLHPDSAKIKIVSERPQAFDPRLLRLTDR